MSFLLALLLFSLACGGTARTAVTISPIQSPPTAIPPTAAPPATNTPPPTPVSAETPTATLAPTIVPTPTVALLVPPPPANAGACANPLYPFILDYEWIYQIKSEEETSKIGLKVAEIRDGQAILNALDMSTGVISQMTVTCQDGAIVNFPDVVMGLIVGDAEGVWQLEHVSGVFAPDYQTFAGRNWELTWEGVYLGSGTLSATVEGETTTGTLDNSPITMTWKTAGGGEALFEAVTVPAGEFPKAIKISRETILDLDISLTSEGTTTQVAAVLILHNTLWLEPNLGLVKQQVERASLRVYGIEAPVDIETMIELLEFHHP